MATTVFPYLSLEACSNASNSSGTTATSADDSGVHKSSVPARQQWLVRDDRLILHRESGACLTRGGLESTNVWGRHLNDGSYAMLFLNSGAAATDVTCDASCWAKTGLPQRTSVVAVRDLWLHTAVGNHSTSDDLTVPQLEPDGGVAMFLLTVPE